MTVPPDPVVTWITVADVAAALGPSTPIPDDGWLAECVAAANTAAYRKRAAAGYLDDPATAPDPAAKLGTVLWAVALWRQRAATDGYPTFEDLSAFTPALGSWGEIRRMLGIGKAATDRAPTDEYLAARARRRRWALR